MKSVKVKEVEIPQEVLDEIEVMLDKKKHKKFKDWEVAVMRKYYKQGGLSKGELAKLFKCTYGEIRWALQRLGLQGDKQHEKNK
jgi:hypothetical protein